MLYAIFSVTIYRNELKKHDQRWENCDVKMEEALMVSSKLTVDAVLMCIEKQS